jgi:RNA polymerase sigma-70 factor (ECF subfamily)
MPHNSLETVWMHGRIARWQAGDRDAADELVRAVAGRLQYLAHRMLGGFANVRREADTADVLQGSLLRLLNTLRTIQPASTRDFVNLAAVHIRRELLDLARHCAVRKRVAADGGAGGDSRGDILAAAAAPDTPPDELELWSRFHEAVERLEVEEREVVSLTFYHGWTQGQIAEVLQVDERTVRRRWQSACLKLHRMVGGELPRP